MHCKSIARFLIFHDVKPNAVESFRAKLQFLKKCTNVTSIDDFFSGNLSSKKINTVITFDDGFKSWVVRALPILKELDLHATFFISSGLIDLPEREKTNFLQSRLLLSSTACTDTSAGLNSQDIKKIVDEGFTVGGHTLNHCNLANLSDYGQLRYEVTEDKRRLEQLTGRKIEYFSYPFGAFHNPKINICKVLEQSGYKGALTNISGFNGTNSNPYLLHRDIMYDSMNLSVFRARSYGNYDAVRSLKKWLAL
jgi:peptidoglycan/xylan/chitin deacetylase (PgdA/CDA1 family)